MPSEHHLTSSRSHHLTPSSTRAFHLALLVLAGTLWGTQPALIKYSVGGSLSEIETGALMMLAVAMLTGAWLAARGEIISFTRPVLAFIAVAGFFEYAAPLMTAFAVAKHIDAGLLTLIIATSPVLTVAIAAAVGHEALSRETVAACAFGLVGLLLILIPEGALPSREMLPWCLAAFAVPALYAVGTLLVARIWPPELGTGQAAFAGSLGASLMLVPWWISPLTSGALLANPPAASLGLAVLVVTLVIEMALYLYLLRNAGPVFTSFSSFVMIASGFVAGMALFGERPSGWIWAAVALFAASLAMIMRKGDSSPSKGEEAAP